MGGWGGSEGLQSCIDVPPQGGFVGRIPKVIVGDIDDAHNGSAVVEDHHVSICHTPATPRIFFRCVLEPSDVSTIGDGCVCVSVSVLVDAVERDRRAQAVAALEDVFTANLAWG